jgi:2-keto-4-pentenoate hydratase/2-oxohepta-3-ene-1,7-dioic acid hydratase in catechol pathway
VSADGRNVTPLAVDARAQTRGALVLVESLAGGGAMPRADGPSLPVSAVELEAPFPLPRRNIFCVGINYRTHAAEFAASGIDASLSSLPEHPVVFSKVPDCVIAPGAAIRIPAGVSQAIDYEAELMVVIGKGGRGIAASRALDHVFGYTIFNDVTARDLQKRHKQFLIGKSLDTYGPMGPWVVTADEIDARDARVRLWVNGEPRQDQSTRDLVFDVATLIESISAGITLVPGDLIATGTPGGVGIGFDPPKYLRSGDKVKIEIDGIGALENPVH